MTTPQKVKISDYCEIASSKRIFASEYLSGGIPFYRGKEITEKQKSSNAVSDLIYISKQKFEEIRSKYGAPQQGDLLLTSVGTIGNPYLVKQDEEFYFKDGNLTWFKNFKNLDSEWLYYWLLSPEGKSELSKSTIGSSQKAYTMQLLSRMRITLPDLPTQRKIASVLSAYDDLIENNEKRIKALEEMAQLLYTEWFVKFKFPGLEKVKMIDSGTEFGQIPEDWCVTTFGDSFNVKYGKTLSTSKISKSGEYKVYGAGGVIGYYDQKNIDTKTALVTCRGNGSGTVWRSFGEGFITNNSFTISGRDEGLGFEFIYSCLKGCNIKGSVTGSAQPQITIEGINFVKFILPPMNLIKAFLDSTTQLYSLSDNFLQRNKNLSETRDLLIPFLMVENG